MKGLSFILLMMLSLVAYGSNLSKADQLVEDARVFLAKGDTAMASSLVTIALLEDKKNKNAKELKAEIEKIQKSKDSKL